MSLSKLTSKEKYVQILELNGIYDKVEQVDVKQHTSKDGMISDHHYVTVTFQNTQLKPLHLFVKSKTPHETHNEMVSEIKAFEKEAQFFSEYVPAVEKFCSLKGLPGFVDFYPTFYYGDAEMTVFENIVLEKGYTLVSTDELQNLEEAKASLSTLAKHHACSHAMIQEEGGPHKFFQRFNLLNFESHNTPQAVKMLEEMYENSVEMSIKLLQKSGLKEAQKMILLLESLKGKTFSYYSDCYKNASGDFAVVIHGDFWNNNMMFLKDTTTKKTIGHKAVDLQITRHASPATDLGVFIFSSVKADLRKEKLMELLEHYLDVLNDLYSAFRRKFRAGFWLGLVVTGPGYFVLKDFDRSEMGDQSNWATYFDELMQKWLDKNPEKGETITKNIMELMKEYEKLLE